jgi:hypothetical protein
MFKVTPIEMITAPNYWAPIPEPRWTVYDPNASVLWGLLVISDSLGERRYIAASGATITATFQKADSLASTSGKLVYTAQSIDILGAFNANDRSLFSITLTADQTKAVVSGTIKFKLIEGSSNTTWVQNHALTKKSANPGF